MNSIYNFIFPDRENKNCDLYFRSRRSLEYYKEIGEFIETQHIEFNTWFNSFPIKKILKYCEIKNIFLEIECSGQCELKIYGSSLDIFCNPKSEIIQRAIISSKDIIKIKDIKNYEQLYVELSYPTNTNFKLKKCSWSCDTKVSEIKKLAIIMCTYKREKYVQHNMEIFSDFISKNAHDAEMDLYIIDNGKTLKSKKNDEEHIKIIENKNAGGAGGFARGMYEASKEKKYGWICLIDDDVEIEPESFRRTITLANYLKDEYKNSFINGCMCDLENQNILFEQLSNDNGEMWVQPINEKLDLNDYRSILKFNEINDEIYHNPDRKVNAGWYYCSFPEKAIESYGLPMPFFIRGDDVEWSWRESGQHILSFNGINIWHSSFDWRVSKLSDYYFSPRNMFYVNAMYNRKSLRDRVQTYFSKTFKYLLETYDYISCNLIIESINDILIGSKVFETSPDLLLKKLNSINDKRDIRQASTFDVFKIWGKEPRKLHGLRYFCYKTLDHGKAAPLFVYKKLGYAPDLSPSTKYFRMYKQVDVVNPITGKVERRKFSKNNEKKLKKQFSEKFAKLMSNLNLLSEDIDSNFDKLTSKEFWEKYLEIKKAKKE